MVALLRGIAYHSFLYGVGFGLSALFIPLHLFAKRVHMHFYYYQSRLLCFFLLFIAGVRLRTQGLHHFRQLAGHSCILISNHVTTLDVPIQLRALREYDVQIIYSQRVVKGIPLIGGLVMRVFNSFGWLSIKRGAADISGLKQVLAESHDGKERRGIILSVYPEGNRSMDGDLMPFQQGAFYLAMRLQLPVVPILMQGVYAIHKRQTMAVHSGEVGVEVLAPIYPPPLANNNSNLKQGVKTLCMQVEDIYKGVPNLNMDANAYQKSLAKTKSKK